MGWFVGGDIFRGAGHDDLATTRSPFGSQVDDPVRRFDHIQVVFDNQHGIAGFDESVQDIQQHLDIGKVETRGRFVQEVQRLAGTAFDQFACQLDPLRFAAGECGGGLTQFEVVEPHIVQRLQLVADQRNVFEMVKCFLDIHLQHIGDRLAFVLHLQRFAIKPMSAADGAGDPHGGQEVHFQFVRAVSLAGLAAAPLDVKAEATRLVAPFFRFGQLGVQLADFVKDFDVGGRIGTGCAADGRLIDGDHLVQVPESFDFPIRARFAVAAIQVATEGLDQDIVDQRTLAGTGNTGHAGKRPQGDLHVDVLEVVVAGAANCEDRSGRLFLRSFTRCGMRGPVLIGGKDLRSLGDAPLGGDIDLFLAGKILSGDAPLGPGHGLDVTVGHNFAATDPRTGPEVDDMIGRPHRLFVMFHNDDGVAGVAEAGERIQQAAIVAGMQADGRFVQDVQHAHQAAADLAGQADTLRFTAGQRRGGAVQREIVEPDVQQEAEPAADFLQHFRRNRGSCVVQPQLSKKLHRLANRQVANFGQRPASLICESRMSALDTDGTRLPV